MGERISVIGKKGMDIKMKKMLVVYYSWSNGNTKKIAEQLADETGADIARIETTEPYRGSHEDVVEQGKREVEAGFMPQINPLSVNLADYDVIAIGTPTWWYTMAPAVLTFLTTNDFTGKTVIPFMTNGGWPGHVMILSILVDTFSSRISLTMPPSPKPHNTACVLS